MLGAPPPIYHFWIVKGIVFPTMDFKTQTLETIKTPFRLRSSKLLTCLFFSGIIAIDLSFYSDNVKSY